MTQVARSALVPFSADKMFSLVADIERYPEFLPWCAAARVHARTSEEVTASLEVSRGPLRKRFTTLNRMAAPGTIHLSLVDGPFKRLRGEWRFAALDAGGESTRAPAGCKVELELDFEFSSRVMEKLLGPVFNEIAGTMVDAFCRRAGELYG